MRLIEADGLRLAKLASSHGHQGVAARVNPMAVARSASLDDLLDQPSRWRDESAAAGARRRDRPHNLAPACAWPMAPAHAVIAPKGSRGGHQRHSGQVASGATRPCPTSW